MPLLLILCSVPHARRCQHGAQPGAYQALRGQEPAGWPHHRVAGQRPESGAGAVPAQLTAEGSPGDA
eukprot:1161782-Pelagomonas_calceolata.AAC.18